MNELNIEDQSKIIKNLNEIDQICTNDILSKQQKLSLYPKFIETLTWIDDHLKSIDDNIALQLLEFLKHFYDVC